MIFFNREDTFQDLALLGIQIILITCGYMMIDYMFDHRDDKKRKAFQRGGTQKPKVQPAYEKVWIHFFEEKQK